MNFDEMFRLAYGGDHTPYPYQRRLAEADQWPEVLSVPTGVGKTAAAVLSWVYRRRYAPAQVRQSTPRRLAYCLPMRTLVEQTYDVVCRWLSHLSDQEGRSGPIGVHLLMGGEDDGKWYESPEQDAILIGTQDMLLSRALNRGYGMSRYSWPVQFALLNNDCQWVIDETQLMGVGLATSAQLAGLRTKLATIGSSPTMWMSATLEKELLSTVDHPLPANGQWHQEQLDDADRQSTSVARLLTARKPCQQAQVSLTVASKKGYEKALAAEVWQSHKPRTLTLVVMNQVARSQDLYQALLAEKSKAKSDVELSLIHSRFRPFDRQQIQNIALNEHTLPAAGRILVATQAIEAGVDISATTLFTELAPWSSLVQRFGRCNRRGSCGHDGNELAQVFWIDIDSSDAKMALPYQTEQLDRARQAIRSLDDVGPQALSAVRVDEPSPIVHVLRRKDLMDLFDTTPDLSGNDLDVSRYIRDSEDSDLQVYWRHWDRVDSRNGAPPPPDNSSFPAPQRTELCSVGVGAFRDFIKKEEKTRFLAWVWDPLDAQWALCEQVRPGMTILLHHTAGGYDAELGWTGHQKQSAVTPVPITDSSDLPDAMNQEETAGNGRPLTIAEHLRQVATAAEALRESLASLVDVNWPAVVRAAWWHDVGKAHPAFQGAMRRACDALAADSLWAKSGVRAGYLRYFISMKNDQVQPQERPGFRHELASALAWLQQHDGEADADLIAYLIAAHHGKVRLSIRSMPNENRPAELEGDSSLFARGIWHGDMLEQVEIGNPEGDVSAPIKLDLRLMQLGDYQNQRGETRPSWLARMLTLRDQWGPFRLAFQEALVRIADWRGSKAQEST
jgi:CRISPR-associated endonuclease/helicase Cas3